MKNKQYTVHIDDLYDFMDESARIKDSVHSTFELAAARCEQILRESLDSLHRPQMAPGELRDAYYMFGEDPYIDGYAKFLEEDRVALVCSQLCSAN